MFGESTKPWAITDRYVGVLTTPPRIAQRAVLATIFSRNLAWLWLTGQSTPARNFQAVDAVSMTDLRSK